MNKINFSVPLSHSVLFDTHARVLAQKLCEKFIGLQFEMRENDIHIFGELNDYWEEQFNKAVFHLGEFEV